MSVLPYHRPEKLRRQQKRKFAWMRRRPIKDYPDGYTLCVPGVGSWTIMPCGFMNASAVIVSVAWPRSFSWIQQPAWFLADGAK